MLAGHPQAGWELEDVALVFVPGSFPGTFSKTSGTPLHSAATGQGGSGAAEWFGTAGMSVPIPLAEILAGCLPAAQDVRPPR